MVRRRLKNILNNDSRVARNYEGRTIPQSRNKEAVNFERMESAGFDFLISDLDLALTMTQIARKSGNNAAKKSRNQRNARRAYDTVQQLANRLALTGTHRKEFDRRLEKLRSELRKLGEEF